MATEHLNTKIEKMDLIEALSIINKFKNLDIRETFKTLEKLDTVVSDYDFENIFSASKIIKEASAQIDEIVHATGIMIAQKKWLEENEKLQYLSLGAGNHKEKFDLETNLRIAEFKFGRWNDKSSNGLRRRGYFSNYIGLLTSEDPRRKYFVVEDKESFLKFIKGKADWRNVLSKNPTGLKKLEFFLIEKGKENLTSVGQIYSAFEESVIIISYKEIMP
ncbi:hypothetical protein B0A63_11330 [Flavobacterium johnsoniae UW101]|uniref:Uncharacterized protein n=1 Tax=Flavobacterium hydatis TaxID=991 RepID=A0A086AIN2_FLAHY|nr:hypothetical protein IW20_10275 [Flavobacterium hydatis]OXA90205.1 hypothetical protein B0A62_19215 [Flavobacterium hydatis]OXE99884.1 hypothetical protein B0A63_11330 [Flavobacterium johnsoniae UW101]